MNKKKEQKKLPDVGDMIMSKKFAYGYHPYNISENKLRDEINIDGKSVNCSVSYDTPEEDRVTYAAKTGKIPPQKTIIDQSAFDKTRANAKFVVETARYTGGGGDHENGWYIEARRLNEDETYNPKAELISFYMTGCFCDKVEPKDVRIVGRMQLMFVKA